MRKHQLYISNKMARKGGAPENLTPFKKGQSGNPKGCPKKTIGAVNQQLEAEGYKEATPTEIKSCYLRLINTEIPNLEKLVKDEEQPALVRIVGKAILSGKGFDIIERMLDRSIGRAQQSMDITSGGEKLSFRIIKEEEDV